MNSSVNGEVAADDGRGPYLDDPNFCPFCGKNDISADDWKVDGVGAFQLIRCKACGTTWHDHFELVGYQVMKRGPKATAPTSFDGVGALTGEPQ